MRLCRTILLMLIVVFTFSGCWTFLEIKTYENFVRHREYGVASRPPMEDFHINSYVIREELNSEEFIYIDNYDRTSRDQPKECVYGYVTKKDDPLQIAIRWEILSGAEYCKSGTLSVFILGRLYLGSKSYEIFAETRDSVVKKRIYMQYFDKAYYEQRAFTKEELNSEEFIYVRDDPSNSTYYNIHEYIPKECIFGYVTKKDDPLQRAIRWEIISGKEYCKEKENRHNEYILKRK